MSNKDLLKQAIAEAKTIREAAIANAKEALEETLTPHLKEMLAQKLQEMDDEDTMEEETTNVEGNIYEAEEEEVEAEEGEEEGNEEEGNEEGEEEEVEIEDMSIEDLKDLIRDIVSQEVGHDESEEEMPGEEAPEGEDLTGMDSEEEININELLAELQGMDQDKGINEDLMQDIKALSKKYGDAGAEIFDKISVALHGKPGEVQPDTKFDKVIGKIGDKLGTKFSGGKPFTEAMEDETVNEDLMQDIKDVAKKYGDAGAEIFDKISVALHGKPGEVQPDTKFDKVVGKIGDKLGTKFSSGKAFGEEVSEELNEALQTVKILRNQLQEVNLLNAKLLYVNKVFKSSNLSEGQKVNVIAAFDKAETVKEVKLVFETVSKNVVAKPVAIREHKSFASKPTGTTTRPNNLEIISEVSETVKRMQKLAGIIK